MGDIILYPLLLVLAGLVSLAAMFWLIVNARAFARVFQTRTNDLEAGPAPRGVTASARSVWIAVILFNAGWIGAVLMWSLGADRADNPPAPGTPVPEMGERLPPAEPAAAEARAAAAAPSAD